MKTLFILLFFFTPCYAVVLYPTGAYSSLTAVIRHIVWIKQCTNVIVRWPESGNLSGAIYVIYVLRHIECPIILSVCDDAIIAYN
jgi:hypothetical protein